jgi:hypothetical protein
MGEVFKVWTPLSALRVSDLPSYGAVAAVYTLRNGDTNELLKFGCTDNLRRRIFGNYIGGVGGSTTQRIHAEIFEKTKPELIEIAWNETSEAAEAKMLESQFRQAFKRAYGRRPVWDLKD